MIMEKNLVDLHTHSVLSRHAYSSLTENIEYAISKGLKVYGISEHQPDSKGVGAHKYAFRNCARLLENRFDNIQLLVGVELNILDEDFDVSGFDPSKLDYCIASMHKYVYSSDHTSEENTLNYIKACQTPYVTFLGHLDYSIFPCDYEKVVKAAKENDKLIELNNASLSPRGSRKGADKIDKIILEHCKNYNVPIIMGSDAHIKYDIGDVSYCINILEEVNFPKELIVNYNNDLLQKYFKVSI